MRKWQECFGIEYPECHMCGMCCRMASPSMPVIKLLAKAAEGNAFARDFLSLFYLVPDQHAKNLSPELYERARFQAERSPKFDSKDQVHFYKCRYLGDSNKCLVYEDRPNLCRDYPDSPFLIMHPGCAFVEWSANCKLSYKKMKEELQALKNLHQALTTTLKFTPARPKKSVYNSIIISPPASWMK